MTQKTKDKRQKTKDKRQKQKTKKRQKTRIYRGKRREGEVSTKGVCKRSQKLWT